MKYAFRSRCPKEDEGEMVMNIAFRVLIFVGLVVGASSVARADSFTFDMGDNSWIDTSGIDPETSLAMWADVYDSVGSELFTLDEGESYSFLFAQVGAAEDWINPDDLNPGTVTAYVDFDIPSVTGDVDGITVGFTAGWRGFTQGWDLVWDDPVVVSFGSGGSFSLELSDASLRNGWWLGPDGLFGHDYANIRATVTLSEAPDGGGGGGPGAGIPEPATISLLGLALAGLVMRRKALV